MTNAFIHTQPDPTCRVCGAPQGAYVRRSRVNSAQWVLSKPGAAASTFWTAAELVRLTRDGLCLETTGCQLISTAAPNRTPGVA